MLEWDKSVCVYDHLKGEAWTEIKFRSREVRENSTQIFTVLRELYCSSFSYNSNFLIESKRKGNLFKSFLML